MKPVLDYIVPWVRQSEPYSDKHMEFAWNHPDVVRMMSNENLLPPSEKVMKAVLAAARQGNLYPDSGPKLRQKIGEKYGLSAENVVLGNGSTDVINFILTAFVSPGDEVIISVPTFPMYETRTRLLGGAPVLVPMKADFTWDISGLLATVTNKTKMFFICSPNNPTGNRIPESELRCILDTGVPTFIDEAYYELEETCESEAHLIKEYPNAMVNRTFSKAYGLAGFRIGYALASEEIISFLNRTRIPWNVSLIGLAAALAGFEDEEDHQMKRANIIQGRQYLYEALNEIPGIRAFPSEGNFVLFDASTLGKTSGQIMNELIERGIFIRPMSGHQMKQGFMRVTVGTPADNLHFIETFYRYVQDSLSGKPDPA